MASAGGGNSGGGSRPGGSTLLGFTMRTGLRGAPRRADEVGSSEEDEMETADTSYSSLLSSIDLDNVRCMNEAAGSDPKAPFKPYDMRMNPEPLLESDDCDPEMIVHIPFRTAVRIHAISIGGPDSENHPSDVGVFVNREDMDFGLAEDIKADYDLDLAKDCKGDMRYSTRPGKFHSVYHLTLFFRKAFGEDESCHVYYIGIYGTDTKLKRGPVRGAVYEVLGSKKCTDATKEDLGGKYGIS